MSFGDADPRPRRGRAARGCRAGSPDRSAGTSISRSLVPGVTLLGTFGLAINRTNAKVEESVTVGSRTISLDLPAGPFVRIFGTGVQLVVAGQTLSGDFSIEQSGTPATTKIVASNVRLRIGTGTTDLITITNGSASFLVSSGGIAGKLSGTVALNIPGITFGGTLMLELNTSLTTDIDHDGDPLRR